MAGALSRALPLFSETWRRGSAFRSHCALHFGFSLFVASSCDFVSSCGVLVSCRESHTLTGARERVLDVTVRDET
jgi:hypothetical protein